MVGCREASTRRSTSTTLPSGSASPRRCSLISSRVLPARQALAEQGIGYLAYSPLGSGLLTGTIAADATFAEGIASRGDRRIGPRLGLELRDEMGIG